MVLCRTRYNIDGIAHVMCGGAADAMDDTADTANTGAPSSWMDAGLGLGVGAGVGVRAGPGTGLGAGASGGIAAGAGMGLFLGTDLDACVGLPAGINPGGAMAMMAPLSCDPGSAMACDGGPCAR